jgi:hypothetical protein
LGYNPTLAAGIFNEFSAGGFRYGHSEVNDKFRIVDINGNIQGNINLLQGFFNPEIFFQNNIFEIESWIRGMATQTQREVDINFIDGKFPSGIFLTIFFCQC